MHAFTKVKIPLNHNSIINKLLLIINSISSMAEEDFDVILNDKEYKELKENKAKLAILQKQIQALKAGDQSKTIKMSKLEKEVETLKEELSFLQALICSIGSPEQRGVEEIPELISSQKSAVIQVLGESIMFPKKLDPKKSQLRSSDLLKRHSGSVEIIRSIEERLESQQALITKLNQMNADKIDLILNQNTDKMLQVLSDRVNLKISTFDELKNIIAQNKTIKEQMATLERDKTTLKNLLRDKTNENEKIKEETKRMTLDYEAKIKKLQGEIVNATKVVKEQPAASFGDRPYRIKLLIDEHIKQMEKSLGGVGGLTSQEINVMLESQLKSLFEYIPKSLEKKK